MMMPGVACEVSLSGPDGVVEGKLTPSADKAGQFVFEFVTPDVTTASGEYFLHVTLDGTPLASSPLKFSLAPVPDAEHSTIGGPALDLGSLCVAAAARRETEDKTCGETTYFELHAVMRSDEE